MIIIEEFIRRPRTRGEQVKEINRQLRERGRLLVVRNFREDNEEPPFTGRSLLVLTGSHIADVSFDRMEVVAVL